MKKRRIFTIFSILMVIALTATGVFAQATNPYYLESQWWPDPSFTGKNPKPGNGLWWRDTTNQNLLSQHTMDEFTGEVSEVYSEPYLKFAVYSSKGGPNVTAIMGPRGLLLVGAGGSGAEAVNAYMAFKATYDTGFTDKHLMGIVLLDASQEQSWGVAYWRSKFRYTPPFPMIVNAAYQTVRAKRDTVRLEMARRQIFVYGTGITTTSGTRWGVDGFLGDGSMYDYKPSVPATVPLGPNDIYISSERVSDCRNWSAWYTGGIGGLTITLDGRPIKLIATSDQDAGLLVFLYKPYYASGGPHLVITRDGGKYLPDAGSLLNPDVTVGERGQALSWALYPSHMGQFTTDPGTWETNIVNDVCSGSNGGALTSTEVLIPTYGLPITGPENVQAALTTQLSALKYLRDQTLKYTNYGYALDDIVNVVKLPQELAASPYNQEFTSTTNFIIRSVYHEYMGWFSGDSLELVGGLPTMEQAQLMVDLAGGADTYLIKAKKALTACDSSTPGDSLPCAKRALFLIQALRLTNPSPQADAVYISALERLAWGTTSAEVRNYYLTLISIVQPVP